MKKNSMKRGIRTDARRGISALLAAIVLVYSVNALYIPVWADASATVTPSTDATAMANSLLGSDCAYTISNAVYTGVGTASGTFAGAKSQVGFDSGVVLSSGNLVVGSNNIFSSGVSTFFSAPTNGQPPAGKAYSDLGFPSNSFHDLSMLEFDVTAAEAGNISFQYCMASEEYPECISVADQFVLTVNGTNYAKIPETDTPVSISTVNHQTNSSFYKGITSNGSTVGAISTTDFVFDGETTVLSVSAPVNSGVNHIVMAIADLGDDIYDSAVFIKAGSIKSTVAQPGVFGFGNKTGTSLEVNRAGGADGFTQVDVTFQDAAGNQISKSTLVFDDGTTTGTIEIPANAAKAILSDATGGATIDPALANKDIAGVSAPTVSDLASITKNTGDTATFTVTASAADNGTLTYQWQKNVNGTWTDISGANAASYTTGKLSTSDNGTQYRCVVTNTKGGATASTTTQASTLTVNEVAAAPVISANPIDVSKYYGESVAFTVTASVSDSGTLTYQWQKNTNGSWTNISGATEATYTIKSISMSDHNVQYRCVVTNSKNGTTTSTTSSAAKLSVKSSVKIVEDRIDALPDPANSSDQTILSNQKDIKETKQLYDKLTDSERNSISQDRKDKLNTLIERLSEVLVVVPKDTTTGVSASGISTAVLLPELGDEDVSKVLVQLTVSKVVEAQNPENIKKAVSILSGDGKELVATYDLALIKSIYDKSNALVTTGKVSNSQIVDYITIRIPVPEGYTERTDLTVVYIDDAGNVVPLTTKLVTIDGVQYLEFQTNHFSAYAVTATATANTTATVTAAATATPKTGDDTNVLGYTLLVLISGMFVLYGIKKKKSVHTMEK